jgi:hypothetical protein
MSSIIINSFYRALTSIDENEGIKNLTVKQLTTLLVDHPLSRGRSSHMGERKNPQNQVQRQGSS